MAVSKDLLLSKSCGRMPSSDFIAAFALHKLLPHAIVHADANDSGVIVSDAPSSFVTTYVPGANANVV